MNAKMFYVITKVLCIMTLTLAMSWPYATGFAGDPNIEGGGTASGGELSAQDLVVGNDTPINTDTFTIRHNRRPPPASPYHATPVPTTILLLGSGLVGLAALRRKFRKG